MASWDDYHYDSSSESSSPASTGASASWEEPPRRQSVEDVVRRYTSMSLGGLSCLLAHGPDDIRWYEVATAPRRHRMAVFAAFMKECYGRSISYANLREHFNRVVAAYVLTPPHLEDFLDTFPRQNVWFGDVAQTALNLAKRVERERQQRIDDAEQARLAAERAAEERALAEKRAAEERALAEKREAEERALAEQREAEERAEAAKRAATDALFAEVHASSARITVEAEADMRRQATRISAQLSEDVEAAHARAMRALVEARRAVGERAAARVQEALRAAKAHASQTGYTPTQADSDALASVAVASTIAFASECRPRGRVIRHVPQRPFHLV